MHRCQWHLTRRGARRASHSDTHSFPLLPRNTGPHARVRRGLCYEKQGAPRSMCVCGGGRCRRGGGRPGGIFWFIHFIMDWEMFYSSLHCVVRQLFFWIKAAIWVSRRLCCLFSNCNRKWWRYNPRIPNIWVHLNWSDATWYHSHTTWRKLFSFP